MRTDWADSQMLTFRRYVDLPTHPSGGFDHAVVDIFSGKVFVTHTANDAIEFVVDEQIKTEEGAHTMAFDQARLHLYVFLPKSCHASVYEES
jgi:hypothetical protein